MRAIILTLTVVCGLVLPLVASAQSPSSVVAPIIGTQAVRTTSQATSDAAAESKKDTPPPAPTADDGKK